MDGFVLHELLQWHHLWSRKTTDMTLEGLEENTFADGVFHLASLAVMLVGIALLSGRRVETQPLIGLFLVGWGLFHLIDQVVFHVVVGMHHVRMDTDIPEVYDWGFFAAGLVLIAAGFAVTRPRRQEREPS